MKFRDSGMPDEAYWETLFDVPLILDGSMTPTRRVAPTWTSGPGPSRSPRGLRKHIC